MKRISILGCGWLGLPLGRFLVLKGYAVKGSVTDSEKFSGLQEVGIEPFRVELVPQYRGDDPQRFLDSDILVINIPPERREDIQSYHSAQIAALLEHVRVSPVSSVVFVSSTSVYPAVNRRVTEQDAVNPDALSGRALLAVEEMLRAESSFRTTVLRFCGLVGYDRSAGSMLQRMSKVRNANHPVNLVHRDDCIGIIHEVIKQGAWGEVFNACSGSHPLRRDYYAAAARKEGLELPEEAFLESPEGWKIIDSSKLVDRLHYAFLVPDPLEANNSPGNV
ncbi:MAG TPA: NAD-dependent epimerase/dehydratase family protein [Prosthecochloris aestuarii]|uniref:NAD-dependent epimerase/dehydratase family protein n=1 Tax=Prosthecochloris aestuarii TaxID=1102 RepID=A0A831SQ72_PROAE|nr:NAD-dependent epimerase/dehydratase family protein [Prosthecochloris aestuarii]